MRKLLSFFLAALILCCGTAATVRADDCCATSATSWYYYENVHYGFCVVCGSTKVEYSSHEFANGVCSVCGFRPCENGAHTPGSNNPHECDNCMMQTDCMDHDGDGLCDLCGEKACRCDQWICVPYEDGCIQQCISCGNFLSEKMRHCFDYGAEEKICLNCGATCSHGNMLWENTMEEHFGRCQDCWEVIAEWGAHNLQDGVCTVCGFGGCDHRDQPLNLGYNNLCHEASCSFCGDTVIPWSEHIYNADGVCEVCGFVGCYHGTLEEAKDITLRYDEKCHWYICNLCEYAYSDMERHVFVDGVCTLCGAAPCQPGDHTLDWEKYPHPCIWCGALIGCVDEDLDCICDLCHSEHHTTVTESTETQHRIYCLTCDLVTEWSDHYSMDAFVGCDYCGHGSLRAEETVEVAENAPEIEVHLPSDSLLTKEEKDQIAAGVSVQIKLNVQNADETVSTEDKAVVDAVIAQSTTGETVAMYLDIGLTKTVGELGSAAITETDEMVTITIAIPEALRQENRVFSVIRVHNGVATQLPDIDKDPATVTIQTDCFSTYALVYGENKNAQAPADPSDEVQEDDEGVPQTHLSLMQILIPVVIAAAVIATVTVAVILIRKKHSGKEK